MLGAIAGDIIGSVYEGWPIKTTDFPLFHPGCRFTDDTVLTVAVADAILSGRPYGHALRDIGWRYPEAGYGGSFLRWLVAPDPQPYGSWGNGAAMRVSPVGEAFTNETEVLREARKTAEVSHDHPEGIKGAQATALAVFLAQMRYPKRKFSGSRIMIQRDSLRRTWTLQDREGLRVKGRLREKGTPQGCGHFTAGDRREGDQWRNQWTDGSWSNPWFRCRHSASRHSSHSRKGPG